VQDKGNAMKKGIKNERELCRELQIDSVDEIAQSEELQERVAQRLQRLSPELLKNLLGLVPELARTFQTTISAMEGIGKSLEESKQIRWKVLRDLAQTGAMSGEQVLEAIRLISDIEKREHIDWNSILKTTIKVSGGALLFVVAVIGGIWAWSESE
jgi:hypothetical protein